SVWQQRQAAARQAYAAQTASFLPDLLPEKAVQLRGEEVLQLLHQRFGTQALQQALDPQQVSPSPLAGQSNSSWIKRVNMVGINVRTIQSFWNVIKYALTLPASQSSVHLLPIWEPGVVSSLYGMASWQINPEFFSAELQHLVPQLNTVERQLKVVVNLLHLMGKTVGMDVIPHTDRYSEITLANPQYFEWLQRDKLRIVNHRANLHQNVQGAILSWLKQTGPAVAGLSYPGEADEFFDTDSFSEAERLRVLFGHPHEQGNRNQRRAQLIDFLYLRGFEPVPATMAPPYRGLEVDPTPGAETTDSSGRIWRDYRITEPQEMSRVFGPLTRYKFYERLDNNENWAIDFAFPRAEVWQYFCERYAAIQSDYQFDFMRGDMSHVQMRAEGVPARVDQYYDPHRAVVTQVQRTVPYFAYFAESFLTAPNFIAYGDEVDHLEASRADSTLGDLQSMPVGSPEFMAHFRRYLDLLATRRVAPNFTIITGDKDDPRFDKFYLHGNAARLFIGFFLTDMPSYLALGFEQRDLKPEPAANEYYTKLYVFQLDEGPKATVGPYRWGRNGELFQRFNRLRLLAEDILPGIAADDTYWLLPPDPTGGHHLIAWTQRAEPRYLFVVNLHHERTITDGKVPLPNDWPGGRSAHLRFSTHQDELEKLALAPLSGHYALPAIRPGEGCCFALAET
ncbi:MAG: hypothetical protein KDC54_24315, partial [Lewinella sp.]|nr:hypothetical protein [Lewinella sp.]